MATPGRPYGEGQYGSRRYGTWSSRIDNGWDAERGANVVWRPTGPDEITCAPTAPMSPARRPSDG